MVLSGAGAGISELICLAGTAELVPVSKRGYYTAAIILTLLPFIPAVMWAQLIASSSSWRWISVLTSGWAFLSLLITVIFYFPPAPTVSLGLDEKLALVKRIDFTGGFLSIAGLTIFEIGIFGAGYQVCWRDPPS